MKLFTLMSLICLSAAASGYSQYISLSFNNAPIENVFNEIEKQSAYHFIYSHEALSKAKPVTINIKNETLAAALNHCLKGQPLSYTIDETFIIIKRTDEMPAPASTGSSLKGKVVYDTGEPIPGAAIFVKGTGLYTVSNTAGDFSFDDVPQDAVLVVSGAEMGTVEMPVSGRSYIIVRCVSRNSVLDETVVIAYGKTTRRFNTGSVSKIKSEEINQQPVQDPIASLAGRVPGLVVTQQNGLPGSNFTVQIRGQNSIQSGNNPLYLIDGVPFLNNSDALTQYSSIFASSPFSSINPQDIESIEVLKDADATAIYGSRGANGVIIITTRKAKAGKVSMDVNLYRGWGTVARKISYLSTPDYINMRREAFNNDGITPDISSAYDFLAWDSTRYTDFQKLLIGGTAAIHSANFSLSAGNAQTKFLVAANYFRATTVFPGDNSDNRVTTNLNISHRSLNQRLNIDLSAGFANDRNNLIPQDLTQYINLPPTTPALTDSTGKLNWSKNGFSFSNPYTYLYNQYNVNTQRLTANAVLSYQLFTVLTLRVNGGYNSVSADETILTPIVSLNPAYGGEGSATFAKNGVQSWIVEPQADLTKTTSFGNFQLTAGATWQENSNRRSAINAGGYTNDALLYSVSGARDIRAENSTILYRYIAAFARISYQLKERYLLNLTARRDGSSRFGPGKQFGNFGAIGAGWIFGAEPFFKNSLPFLSYGKLRGSYGVTGNDQIGNYQYLDTYTTAYFQYQGQPVLNPSRLYNGDLNWERNKKLEAALELGLFKNRLMVTASWYRNRSDNQLIYYLLPAQTGFYNVLRNFPGVVENKGWEFDISTVNIKSESFNWTTSFNLTVPRNRLVSFPGLEGSSYGYLYREGKPLNSVIGLAFKGIDPATGIYQFEDDNKDGVIDDDDYAYRGHLNPVYFGGFVNDCRYRNLELQFHFMFVKQSGPDLNRSASNIFGNAENQPSKILDRWQRPGDIATYQHFTQQFYGTPIYTGARNAANSDAALTDASFVRLRNVSLAYTFPALLLKPAKIEKLRIYMQGQNLLTITRYQGLDPETKSSRSLPPLRVLTAGIQITF